MAPTQLETLSRAELLALAQQQSWVHRIDLGDGFVTHGLWGDGNPEILRAMGDIDFTGKKVLDIGCWDGRYSFEAEERGAAEVHATDLISQRDFSGQPTFEIARVARGSRALYHSDLSVYDAERLGINDFDIVIFTGIYYHLKDPLRALAALRRVMRTGGAIIVEGAITEQPGCFADFYYRNVFEGDTSNWWVPTVDCLNQWIACSQFEISHEYERWGNVPRHCVLATATHTTDPLYKWPDQMLDVGIPDPIGAGTGELAATAIEASRWQERALEAERRLARTESLLATRRARAGLALGRALDRIRVRVSQSRA